MKIAKLTFLAYLLGSTVLAHPLKIVSGSAKGSTTDQLSLQTADATVGSTTNSTNDTATDFEPAMVRAQKADGTVATVTMSIKVLSDGTMRNFYVSNDGLSTTSGLLPLPAGQTWSYDPTLYPNLFTSGVAPGRLYCAGIVSNGTLLNNQIAVWRSDDLGRGDWATPTIVEAGGIFQLPDNLREERTLDKPTVTVGGYSASKGYVYVSYLRQSVIKNSSNLLVKRFYSIWIARSTDGGTTFGAPVKIWTNEADTTPPPANCAHVIASPGNGYIYVTWAVYSPTNRIMLARSPASGTVSGTWVVDSTGPTGNFNKDVRSNGMQAMTIPITRYNWVANKIAIVWNERETTASSSRSDVYYAEKGPAGWTTWNGVNKLRLSNEASPCVNAAGTPVTTDQLRPAIDFDATGKMTVVYYDRQGDCANNNRYNVYFTQIDRYATVVQPPTLLSPFNSSVSENNNRIGEYFDIWCETAICYTAWIGTPNLQGDVFVSTIQ